jgi:hypothetical protein
MKHLASFVIFVLNSKRCGLPGGRSASKVPQLRKGGGTAVGDLF